MPDLKKLFGEPDAKPKLQEVLGEPDKPKFDIKSIFFDKGAFKDPMQIFGELGRKTTEKVREKVGETYEKEVPEFPEALTKAAKLAFALTPGASSLAKEDPRQVGKHIAMEALDPINLAFMGGGLIKSLKKGATLLGQPVVIKDAKQAVKIGQSLKGSKQGIAELESIQKGLVKQIDEVKKVGDLEKTAELSYQQGYYTEAIDVAKGGGKTNIKVGEELAGEAVSKVTKKKTTLGTVEIVENVRLAREENLKRKIVDSLKKVKPLRGEQERLYTKERIQRAAKFAKAGEEGGEIGFRKQMAQLKGEMKKVEFESMREKGGFAQTEVDELFNMIERSELRIYEQAKAGTGLGKIFGEFGGKVPQKSEIELMEKVFGADLTKALLDKRSWFVKAKEAGYEIANIPRSLMASFDLSFGFRQGIWVATRHPKIFFKNWVKQFKMFGSEKYYKSVLDEIHSRPTFDLMQKHKLSFTELKGMTQREEAFMSNWAEKIPVIGRGVRASGRAFTGFADRLRADLFDYMLDFGKKYGVSGETKYLDDAAKFINNATGRGHLPGMLEKSALALNTVFFSPRLLFSRLNLAMNPVYYAKMHPVVRKEAIKSLFAFGVMAGTVSGIAKLAGADVETDPRNANFAKIRIGNTRFDPLGGFQQPIRTAFQVASNKIISSTTGKEITLGEGYKATTPFDVLQRFLEMKESPIFSFATGLLKGQNAIGEKMDIPTEVANRFIPMVMQDAHDLYKEGGLKDIPMAVPAIFGVGVQTYGGVMTWGLNGRDHPELNKELIRIKSGMGFPSSSAHGFELSNSEYKELKKITGTRIVRNLNRFIKTKEYKAAPDHIKKRWIEKEIDKIKRETKVEVFPLKLEKSKAKKDLRKEGFSDEDIKLRLNEIFK